MNTNIKINNVINNSNHLQDYPKPIPVNRPEQYQGALHPTVHEAKISMGMLRRHTTEVCTGSFRRRKEGQ